MVSINTVKDRAPQHLMLTDGHTEHAYIDIQQAIP
jgi:hypothetical protein